jgi:hypothetical protein
MQNDIFLNKFKPIPVQNEYIQQTIQTNTEKVNQRALSARLRAWIGFRLPFAHTKRAPLLAGNLMPENHPRIPAIKKGAPKDAPFGFGSTTRIRP